MPVRRNIWLLLMLWDMLLVNTWDLDDEEEEGTNPTVLQDVGEQGVQELNSMTAWQQVIQNHFHKMNFLC